uniref:Uncharacterized protein n=1 Tax=Kalanchoe fedtschenkoi TaxID=63787 RepID=A0A7N0VB50_KALFE
MSAMTSKPFLISLVVISGWDKFLRSLMLQASLVYFFHTQSKGILDSKTVL